MIPFNLLVWNWMEKIIHIGGMWWNFFLKGKKKIWGYIIDTLYKPMNWKDDKYAEQLDVWEVNNSKIIT